VRAIILRARDDCVREKVLVPDWPDPPPPHTNQVRIKTLYSGITNGTERNQLHKGNYAPGDRLLPMPTGYQTVGRVIETGPDTKSLQIGDHIFVGKSTGGHLEYIVVAEDKLLIKLPDEVDLSEAAIYGMAAVALNTIRNAAPQIGEKVLVVGAGCVGQVAAQFAALQGACVTICDIDEPRLEIARQIGAAEQVLNVEGAGWSAHIADESFDAVLDFAGVPGMEEQLILAMKTGGRVLLIAGRDRVTYPFNLAQRRLITVKQNSHFYVDDLENLARLHSRGRIDLSSLIQDVAAAEEAKRIYDTLRDRPNELLGTVFSW
jgi:2-desacetyl-2-hydroxyethyl bacteriochlorophyllide A dehydrogenase